MYLIENYDFLWDLVKNGQADKTAPFLKNGLCLTDDPIETNFVFVFHFDDGFIWATYAYIKAKNKRFYSFFQDLKKIMFSFNLPILRKGANMDFKNHTRAIGKDENGVIIYEFVRGE